MTVNNKYNTISPHMAVNNKHNTISPQHGCQ